MPRAAVGRFDKGMEKPCRACGSTFRPAFVYQVAITARLAEAPSHRKSIFEYAPQSHGASDYNRVVDWLLASAATQHQSSGASTDAPAAA